MLRSFGHVHAILLISTFAFVAACGDDSTAISGAPPAADAGVDVQAEAQVEAQAVSDSMTLPTCPDEVDLSTVDLPCNCYGNVASDPQVQVPGCTKVVCSASISNLGCEDEEPDAAPDAEGDAAPDATPDAASDAAPDALPDALPDAAPVAACPIEKDLSTVSLPCSCYGTVVEDPAVSMPACTLTVVCCPAIKGLKCE